MEKSSLEKTGKAIIQIGLLVISFIFFIELFFVSFYFHEVGHMLFGSLDGLMRGNVPSFTIGAWVNHPAVPFLKLPQQTVITDGNGSLNFALGGPIFMILLFAFFSFVGYRRSGNRLWFILLASVFLFEVGGNIICGTDNFFGRPLSVCDAYNLGWIEMVSVALFAFTFTLLFYLSTLNKQIVGLLINGKASHIKKHH